MNTPAFNTQSDLFQSYWLQSLIRPDQYMLPPPLPTLPGVLSPKGDGVPSNEDDNEGNGLSRYYFERPERAAIALAEKREGQIIGQNIGQFLKFSRGKLGRVFQDLEPKQRSYLALVPYLLNANAPAIPGYQPDPSAQYGLFDVDFNATTMRAVEQIFGHRKKFTARRGASLLSLFFDTELGTMSGSPNQEIRFWVITKANALQGTQGELLRQKTQVISEWLTQKGLDATFILIDFDDYDELRDREGHPFLKSMSLELIREHLFAKCGFFAGQIPLWWAAPAGIKPESYTKLVSGIKKTSERFAQSSGIILDSDQPSRTLQSFVSDRDQLTFVDLGTIIDPSPSDLLDCAFERLNESLKNPFAGMLSMAIYYARSEGVPFSYVCDRIKKAITQGEHEVEQTEFNLIGLDVLNHHFRQSKDRFFQRLFRMALYLQFAPRASKTRATNRSAYVMRRYAAQWGWDKALLEELDQFNGWTAEQVDAVGKTIRGFLLDLYRRMSREAQSRGLEIDTRSDVIRRRRLSACFEGMPAKVPHLFTYFLPSQPKEEHLVFVDNPQSAPQARWEIYREGSRNSGGAPLYTGETLTWVATWAVFNGIFHPHTVVNITSPYSEYNLIEGRALLHKLHYLLTYDSAIDLPDQAYIDPPKIKRLLLSISPTSFEEESSSSYASHGWDILNYGQRKKSQLTDISLVMQNSWGEVFSKRYRGESAFTQAMKALFADGGNRIDLDLGVEILGPNDRVLPIVRKRITEVINQAIEVFNSEGATSKIFAYEVSGQFQILAKDAKAARMSTARTLRGVVRRCGQLNLYNQELLIDQLSPSLREIRAMILKMKQDSDAKVYIGWRRTERLGFVIVCDERGRLFFQQSSARETRLSVMRIVRRTLPYLRAHGVVSAKDMSRSLRVFEFQEGQMVGGRKLIFSEATGTVLKALSQAYTGTAGLWLVGQFDQGRAGLGLLYGKEVFMASRYGSSFVYACVKHIVEKQGLDDPETWTLDGSKVNFGPKYRDVSEGATQHLRLVALYQKEITKALNYILQHHLAGMKQG